MGFNSINPSDVIFSLDIGTRTVIGTVGVVRDKKFQVIAEKFTEHEERAMIDGQIHDINLVAKVVSKIKQELEKELNFNLREVAIAAAGRFLRTSIVKAKIDTEDDKEIDKEMLRGLELTAVKAAEEEINKNTSGKLYCVGYSVKSYYLNGYAISNLLSHKGENIEAEVIATFLPRSVVESLYIVMNKVDLRVSNITLEPIAAMEAVIPQNLRLLNLSLVDVGAGTSDIAICSKDTISAYGMIPMAGDEVTEVIAQNYLVDFNTAEKIKRDTISKRKVSYVDVLGIENNIASEEVVRLILPIVDKISGEIVSKIIELNGGKSPNAVFLVGGGAYTPMLKELIAEKLNIPLQRIAIKGRESVTDCICHGNDLGSIGVTVLGIALIAIKCLGNNFIDVVLNDSIVSMFNSQRQTVMDVIVQAGLSPKVILGKNGKNVRFTLNDSRRVAFGSIGKSAVIKINGIISNIESAVKEGDKIKIDYARNGEDANPRIIDYVKKIESLSFYLDNIIVNIETIFLLNNENVNIDKEIREGDNIKTIFPNTILLYKKYCGENGKISYYKNNELLSEDYVIIEGDEIFTKKESKIKELDIIVNENSIKLKGKENYIFVDIFNYIDFDLNRPKGSLVFTLNGNNAGFYDTLNYGDIIELKWSDI